LISDGVLPSIECSFFGFGRSSLVI